MNITVGTNARVHGICCIAIGDNSLARGAYQVVVTSPITIPSDITKEQAVATITEIREMKLTYAAMVEQKVAPAAFRDKSAVAIDKLVNVLEQHFDKPFDSLVKDVEEAKLLAANASAINVVSNVDTNVATSSPPASPLIVKS